METWSISLSQTLGLVKNEPVIAPNSELREGKETSKRAELETGFDSSLHNPFCHTQPPVRLLLSLSQLYTQENAGQSLAQGQHSKSSSPASRPYSSSRSVHAKARPRCPQMAGGELTFLKSPYRTEIYIQSRTAPEGSNSIPKNRSKISHILILVLVLFPGTTPHSASQNQTLDRKAQGPGTSSSAGGTMLPASSHLPVSRPPGLRPDSGQARPQTHPGRSASKKRAQRPPH